MWIIFSYIREENISLFRIVLELKTVLYFRQTLTKLPKKYENLENFWIRKDNEWRGSKVRDVEMVLKKLEKEIGSSKKRS